MKYYCVKCQDRKENLSDVTGKNHENPKADHLSGENYKDCGGDINHKLYKI